MLRAGGLAAAVIFALVAWRLVVPQKGVVMCAAIASVLFALTDLAIEHAANIHGIWVCIGSFQVAHVPALMLAQFVFQGIGFCLVMYAVMRRRRGARLFVDMSLLSVALAFILFMLEFVWRDMGVTIYLKPYTWVYVLLAWNALLAVLFSTFYLGIKTFIGTDGILSKQQVRDQGAKEGN